MNYKISLHEKTYLRKYSNELLDKEQESDNILKIKTFDFTTPKYNFDLPFKVKIPTRSEWHTNDLNEIETDLKFYTDGSKTEEGTGFGIYGNIEISRNMENTSTIFQAEAKAITTCAEEILKQNIKDKDIHIYSDSQAVLKALIKHKTTSKTIQECIDKLKEVGQFNKIELIWIPGHEGFEGNEKADELARKGAQNVTDPNKVKSEIALNVIKTRVKEWRTTQSNVNWRKTFGARHTKTIIRNYSQQRTRSLLQLQRTELKNLIGFMTGHGPFKQHLYRMKLVTSPECKFCNREETAEHIMCECDAYCRIRLREIGKPYCSLEDFSSIDLEKFRRFCKAATIKMWTPSRR